MAAAYFPMRRIEVVGVRPKVVDEAEGESPVSEDDVPLGGRDGKVQGKPTKVVESLFPLNLDHGEG